MKPFELHTLPLKNLDWERFVPFLGKAHAALGRYDGVLQTIPNANVLLAPLATQEAVLSSRIEGTQATLQEVLTFEARPNSSPPNKADIQEVLNYRAALHFAGKDLQKRPFCLNLLRDMHGVLMDSARGQHKDRGNFRRIQNWIGPPGSTIETAAYVPPSPERLMDFLDNFEKYYHWEEKDPLVQLAILHGQFEVIHPFLDGNGRIGRLMLPLFLFDKGLLSSPNFYMSAFFEANRQEYYQKLRRISSDDDWQGWIEYFLGGIMELTKQNVDKALSILDLYQEMKSTIAETTRSRHSICLLDFLFQNPFFTSKEFAETCSVSKRTSDYLIARLKKGNIISILQSPKGKSSTLYLFNELINRTG